MATVCAVEGRESAMDKISRDYRLASSSYVYQPYEITALTDSNEVSNLLFLHKPSLEWSQFKSSVAFHLRAKEDDIDELKPIMMEGEDQGSIDQDIVSVCQFKKILKWFSPLVPEVDGRATGSISSSSVWRISSIADILRQPWFHGFAPDVNNRLRYSPGGTFLLRFGTQAPHFLLALKDKSTGSIVEYRVLCMSGSVRLVDSERFVNLQQLVENYSHAVPAGASCPIEFPCRRNSFSKHVVDR